MKLCSTATSPYGRLARMVRSLKSLEARVPFEVVQTRGEGNPFYDMNPSGRVPCLIFDDGTVLEESSLVCWYPTISTEADVAPAGRNGRARTAPA